LGGALLWISLYQIYEANLDFTRSELINRNSEINMSFMPFPPEFLGFCVWFTIIVFLIRLISEFFFQKYQHLFLSWLLTGVISTVVINLMLSSAPVPIVPQHIENHWFCCIDNSTGYLLWVITFLIIVLYTILFVSLRKLIMPKQEPFK
jgi:hypothetical protein